MKLNHAASSSLCMTIVRSRLLTFWWLSGEESANAWDMNSVPGSGISLEKEIATRSSILAWEISWTEEPSEPQSMELQRVQLDWVANTFMKILDWLGGKNFPLVLGWRLWKEMSTVQRFWFFLSELCWGPRCEVWDLIAMEDEWTRGWKVTGDPTMQQVSPCH